MLLSGVAVGVVAQPQAGPQGAPHARIGRGPGGPGGVGLPGLRELDLSDAQKEQIKTITQSHRDEIQKIAERTREANRAIDQASNVETVDEAAIRAQSTALATAIADGAILRARVNAEIFNVLTAEQQQKLKDLRAQRQERGPRRR
jgi:protein CpxP